MAEMRRGISIRLGVDDGEARRRIVEFGTTAETALRRVEGSGEGSAREIRQLANAIEAAKRQADPLYAAQLRLAKVTADYNAAVRRGIATEEERTRVLGQLQQRYDQLAARQAAAVASAANLAVANANASRFSGQFGQRIQQVGYQVGDFAVQVASGGNAMTAFVQQGSQLLGILGPAGAIAGAGLAIAGVAANFLLLSDNTKTAAEAQRELADNLSEVERASDRATGALGRLSEQDKISARTAALHAIEELKRQKAVLETGKLADLRAQLEIREAAFTGGRGSNDPRRMANEARQLAAAVQAVADAEAEVGRIEEELGRTYRRLETINNAPTEAAERRARAGRSAAAAAKEQRAAERDLRDGVAQYIEDLRVQNELLQLEEGERERVRAVMEAQARAMAEGNLLTAEQIALIRDLVDENRAMEQASRDRKRAEDEAARQAERAAQEQRRIVERSTDDVIRYAGDAFADLFSETGRGWRGMWDDMVSWARRSLARLAAEMVLRPIIQPIMASVLGGGGAAGAGVGGIGGVGGAGGGFGLGGLGNLTSLGGLLGGNSLFGGSFSAGATGMSIAQGLGFGPATQSAFFDAGLRLSSPAGILGGFAGNMLADLVFGNRGIGSQIGGTIGAVAGSFIPIPFVGTAIGGFLGNLIGGLFGSDKKQARLQTLTSPMRTGHPGLGLEFEKGFALEGPFGYVGFEGSSTRRVDSDILVPLAKAIQGIDRMVASLIDPAEVGAVTTRLQSHAGRDISGKVIDNEPFAVVRDRFQTILEELGVGAESIGDLLGSVQVDPDNIPELAQAVQGFLEARRQLRFLMDEFGEMGQIAAAARAEVAQLTGTVGELEQAHEKYGLDAEKAAETARRVVEEFLGIREVAEPMSEVEQAIAALNARFAEAADLAAQVGIGQGAVDAAQRKALEELATGFDDANRRAILAITDPLALALEDFDKVAEQRLEDVRALGADTVLVERRNMLERQKIVEEFASRSAAALSDLPRVLQGLTGLATDLQLGPLSALSPDERYRMAEDQFAAISLRAAAGDATALQGFEGVARSFLEVSRARYGSTADYAGDFARVVSALDKLSAQPETNWQRLDATIAEGNSESARLLRGLIDEVRRLRTEVRQAGTLRPARVA